MLTLYGFPEKLQFATAMMSGKQQELHERSGHREPWTSLEADALLKYVLSPTPHHSLPLSQHQSSPTVLDALESLSAFANRLYPPSTMLRLSERRESEMKETSEEKEEKRERLQQLATTQRRR
jgi:hypothetical protein